MKTKPFSQTLTELRKGLAHEELGDKLQEAVRTAVVTAKQTTLVLTITVKPNGSGAVMISDEIKLKLPNVANQSSYFFVDEDSNPVREDPYQYRLEGLGKDS